ncbi:MAG: crossover junction endodeoxyribonuclease RuvC [Bacteroidales bacterium]|jgi:crossover junction endodeoxyribonuclease RuvC|nr:crossover junction endodeoxyribonuclease RuvC [Bacteroidales bacterium]
MKPDKVILGIDPGTQMLGWGVIGIYGNKTHYISMGVFNLKKEIDHFSKIASVYREVDALIIKYKPDELAIEAPFYGKNIQSMLKLGRAQGAAISAALNHNMPITEYAPKKVKMSITGKGAASKEQVATVLLSILAVEDKPGSYDATDGLAVAFCHCLNRSSLINESTVKSSLSGTSKGKAGGSWDAFVKNNPSRIK